MKKREFFGNIRAILTGGGDPSGGGGPLSLVSNLSGESGADCLTATIRIRAGVKAESSNKWCR